MEEKKIYSAICGVMADVGAVEKNSQNMQQNFMFRGIDAVMNALSPALIKNRVFIVPEVTNEERTERTNAKGNVLFYTRLFVTYRFYTDDGSYIEAKVIGEAMDTGDKATNKAMSIAYKYACFQVFNIPTKEMPDPDSDCHEVKPKASEQSTASKVEPEDPVIDDVKKTVLLKTMKEADVTVEQIFETLKGVDSIDKIRTTQWVKLIKKLEKTIETKKKMSQEVNLGL